MKSGSVKEKQTSEKNVISDEEDISSVRSAKSKTDEDDDDDIDEEPVKKGKTSSKKKDDEDDDADEVVDDWEKVEDDDYDPDFEEFDIPKSKIKAGPAKKGKGEDELELDDDFKTLDLFDDGTSGVDDDDDDDF